MANIALPAFPARSAGVRFVKGLANNGTVPSAAQYVTFGHSFQIGELARGSGLGANFGGGSVPCQVDAKTSFEDGSVAHAIVTVRAPSVAAGATAWGQFSAAAAPAGSAMSLGTALGSTTLSLALAPTPLPDWAASAAEPPGALTQPTAANPGGFLFQCTVAGTTGAAEPTAWPQSVGTTISDGAATWTNVGGNVPSITQDLVALARNAAPDLWLSGPLAVQGRASATLAGSLRVAVDATVYADGTALFDVMLANDIAAIITSGFAAQNVGTVAYSASLTLNGAVAFQSGPLEHYLYQNWTRQVGTVPHPVNSSQDATLQIIHDPNDFIAAQSVQPFDTVLGVAPSCLTGASAYPSAAGFAQPLVNPQSNPADNTSMLVTESMGDVGGRPDIGIDDIFVVWWFVTQNSAFQRTAFECAKVNGVVPWHFFNPATGEPWTTDDAPTLWSELPPWESAVPSGGNAVAMFAERSAAPGWGLDQAHFPELVYLQYLTTGRRYFLDELNHVTAWQLGAAAQSAPFRNYDQGLIMRETQVRASAWGMRNFNYAVYANPDGSRLKLYFRRMLDNNLYWFVQQLEQYQATQGPELYGYFPTYAYGAFIAAWEENYLISSLTFSAMLGHPIALQICQWMAHFFVGLLTNGSNDPLKGFPPAQAVTYDYQLFPMPPGIPGDTGSPYSWGSIYSPAQTWDALESMMTPATCSDVNTDGTIFWNPAHGSGGAYGDYGQLCYIGLVGLQTVGIADAANALGVLVNQVAADGTHPPTLNDTSWAQSNVTWRTVPRTLNASRILPSAAAPAATMLYSSPQLAAINASVAMAAGSAAPVRSIDINGAATAGPATATASLSMARKPAPVSITTGGATVAAVTVERPVNGWLAGNWLIAVISAAGGSGGATIPAGWTKIASAAPFEAALDVFALQLTTDGPPDYTFAANPHQPYQFVIIVEYDGQRSVGGLDNGASATGNGSSITWPAVVTADPNELVLLTAGGAYSYPLASPPGFTTEVAGGMYGGCGYYLADAFQQMAGAAGAPFAPLHAASNWAAIALALRPAPIGAILSAAPTVGRVTAAATLDVLPPSLRGAASLQPVSAAAILALPSYATLSSSVSAAVTQLQAIHTALQQQDTALTVQIKSIETTLAAQA